MSRTFRLHKNAADPRLREVATRRATLEDLRGRRVLQVASTGGHLTQLVRLAPRLGFDPSSPWVTFDTPQSRSLLAGRDVTFVPYVAPRDVNGVMRATMLARDAINSCDGAISTGAGLALSILPPMAALGRPAVYLESISRVDGPSLTGRMLSRLPLLGLYCQHPSWAAGPWRAGPSVLSAYDRRAGTSRPCRRMLVTLGTIAPYRFDRLVDAVVKWLDTHPDVHVTWQIGATTRTDLPGEVHGEISDADFGRAIEDADIVVAHAGVGIAMRILDAGKVPVLMARRQGLREHVDDHQQQIHDYLTERGLAVTADSALSDDTVLSGVLSSRIVADSRPLVSSPSVPPTTTRLERGPVDRSADAILDGASR